jgi:hypothetical protein
MMDVLISPARTKLSSAATYFAQLSSLSCELKKVVTLNGREFVLFRVTAGTAELTEIRNRLKKAIRSRIQDA